MSENQKLIDRVATMLSAGTGTSGEDAKRVLPIGSAAHVREVVERYAAVGITQISMMAQAPWKREIYQRLNEEIVAPFAQVSSIAHPFPQSSRWAATSN